MRNIARTKRFTEEVLSAFLECKSIREIQERTGLSRTMITKYRSDPDFCNELARRKTKAVEAALARMQLAMEDVVTTVVGIAQDENVSPQVRLNASQILLGQCKSWTEMVDIVQRLEKLENAVDSDKLTEKGCNV